MRWLVLVSCAFGCLVSAGTAKSEMVIGSNPVFVPLARHMAKSPQDFECVFEFLRASEFSTDACCKETNRLVAGLFEMRGLDTKDAATIARVHRDLTAMLLRLSGIQP